MSVPETLSLHPLDGWYGKLTTLGTDLVVGAIVFIAFWVGAFVARAVLRRLAKRYTDRSDIYRLLAKVAYVTLLVVGAVTALGTAGVNISGVIAGLGLAGFALGFAFKDLLASTLAGVMILLDRPFHNGDRIKVADFEGVVERIDLRYIALRGDNANYLVPNATVLTSPVTVYSEAQSAAAEN